MNQLRDALEKILFIIGLINQLIDFGKDLKDIVRSFNLALSFLSVGNIPDISNNVLRFSAINFC